MNKKESMPLLFALKESAKNLAECSLTFWVTLLTKKTPPSPLHTLQNQAGAGEGNVFLKHKENAWKLTNVFLKKTILGKWIEIFLSELFTLVKWPFSSVLENTWEWNGILLLENRIDCRLSFSLKLNMQPVEMVSVLE